MNDNIWKLCYIYPFNSIDKDRLRIRRHFSSWKISMNSLYRDVKDIKRGVFRFFPRKGLHFFLFLGGGRQTPPPKKKSIYFTDPGGRWALIAPPESPLDNNIDVFKKFTNIFGNGVRFERTKLSSFKDKFL